jgi:hypothetical protein
LQFAPYAASLNSYIGKSLIDAVSLKNVRIIIVVVVVVLVPLSCSRLARFAQVSTGSVESDSFLYRAVKFSVCSQVPVVWDVRHLTVWHHIPEAVFFVFTA